MLSACLHEACVLELDLGSGHQRQLWHCRGQFLQWGKYSDLVRVVGLWMDVSSWEYMGLSHIAGFCRFCKFVPQGKPEWQLSGSFSTTEETFHIWHILPFPPRVANAGSKHCHEIPRARAWWPLSMPWPQRSWPLTVRLAAGRSATDFFWCLLEIGESFEIWGDCLNSSWFCRDFRGFPHQRKFRGRNFRVTDF